MQNEIAERKAKKFLQQGLDAASQGEFEKARKLFKQAVENRLSAEGLTYWAWMEHHLGDTYSAIRLCRLASEIDPDFGNPYNDIGSYLMALGDLDQAVEFLQQAVKSRRYEPRHFPHINLARIYLAKKRPLQALDHYKKALHFSPGNPEILRAIQKVVAKARQAILPGDGQAE